MSIDFENPTYIQNHGHTHSSQCASVCYIGPVTEPVGGNLTSVRSSVKAL
jgi:hypothetical protein